MTQRDRNETTTAKGKKGAAVAREARLKQALKANMARRKAQARARDGQGTADTVQDAPNKEE